MDEELEIYIIIQAFFANLIPFIILFVAVLSAKRSKRAFSILFFLGCGLRALTLYTFYKSVNSYGYYGPYTGIKPSEVEIVRASLNRTLVLFLFGAFPLYFWGKDRCKAGAAQRQKKAEEAVSNISQCDQLEMPTSATQKMTIHIRQPFSETPAKEPAQNTQLELAQFRFCKNCGRKVRFIATYCPGCGTKMPIEKH